MAKKSVVALLLVKAHSKRLPGKNVMNVKGKPMFLWNVEKCLELFKHVYVSSDSETILQMAETAGAIPIKRGEALCGDTPDIGVYVHASASFPKAVLGMVAVHANNPTIDVEDIRFAKELIERGFQEVMTCHPTTHGEDYHNQHNKIYGSIRGLSMKRLLNYGDAYKPNPDVLWVDKSIEVETQETFDLCLKQAL